MRLAFAGTPEFAERALAELLASRHSVELVLTQPDRPAGRGMRAAESPVKRLALQRHLPLFQPPTLKSNEAIQRLEALEADALVVAAYGLLLPVPALRAARRGAINIHASLLPRWRGAAPIQRALLAGDVETGISIMQMDEGLDTGAVLSQHRVAIESDDTAGTLHDKLAALGAKALIQNLDSLESGAVHPTPQPSDGVTYASKIAKAETRLEWSCSAEHLERAVRAFNPAPGATVMLGDEAVKVWRAAITDGVGRPGDILNTDPLVVACGEDGLLLQELQRPGGKRMSAAEYVRGHGLARGRVQR